MKSDDHKPTTADTGIPVPSDAYALTVGPNGPGLIASFLDEEKPPWLNNA